MITAQKGIRDFWNTLLARHDENETVADLSVTERINLNDMIYSNFQRGGNKLLKIIEQNGRRGGTLGQLLDAIENLI